MLIDRRYLSKQALLYALLFLAFVFTFFPVWKALIGHWYRSDDYSHGFFIIPICIYILWQKRKVLANIKVGSSNWGLVAGVVSLMIYVLGYLAGIATVVSLSMVMMIVAIVIYLYGFRVFKETIFPLSILFFMIPVPAQIYATLTVPLQFLVSKASVSIASVADIPIYRAGNVIILPDYTLEVARACSGLRSMVSLFTLSAVFGYFTLNSNHLRWILFVSAVPTAIIVNIIRVVIVIAAFYFFDYDLTRGSIHTAFGMIIFVIALLLIAICRGVLSRWEKSAREE